jgi:hypothetical protein
MNQTEYASHPIRNLLDGLIELSGTSAFTNPDLLASDASEMVESIFAVAINVRDLIVRTPAYFVSKNGLANVQNGMNAVLNELISFINNSDQTHIIRASQHIENSVLPTLWAFAPTQLTGGEQLTEVINQQIASSKSGIRQLVVQRDELMSQNNALSQQIQDAQGRLESLSETVKVQKAEAATVVTVVQQMHAEKEIERMGSFEATLKELRDGFDKFQTGAQQQQEQRLEALRISQEQASKIVEVVGNTGITGNYQKIAKAETAQANFWRWVTIGLFAAGLGIAGLAFIKFWRADFSNAIALSTLIRLLTAFAVAAPALYTARESTRHRMKADRASQTELELASFGPFIELMPDDKKNQIREEMAKRYFGNQFPDQRAESTNLLQELRALIDLVRPKKE